METIMMRLVEVAREMLKTCGYFVDNLWHVDDIHFICEQCSLPAISDDEAMQVFVIANQQFNGENGISWPQLEKALHTYLHGKSVLSSFCESSPV